MFCHGTLLLREIQLCQIRPGEELQEATSLVTIGKLCFSKYVSGFISVNRSSLDDSCVFIWSSFFQTYPVSMQVCIQMYVQGLRRAVCKHTFKPAITQLETTIKTSHKNNSTSGQKRRQ